MKVEFGYIDVFYNRENLREILFLKKRRYFFLDYNDMTLDI